MTEQDKWADCAGCGQTYARSERHPAKCSECKPIVEPEQPMCECDWCRGLTHRGGCRTLNPEQPRSVQRRIETQSEATCPSTYKGLRCMHQPGHVDVHEAQASDGIMDWMDEHADAANERPTPWVAPGEEYDVERLEGNAYDVGYKAGASDKLHEVRQIIEGMPLLDKRLMRFNWIDRDALLAALDEGGGDE